ncbi:DsbC family protein [Pandoraea communis]|uniref:DsbC family protein n=1 Tax=Pandoraea communis TaxID=2508297 RepID=UPI0025A4CCDD|nr:DsbC family protein [Pandoraea communis]MDM8356495.1 DsbC family protein [Pandoraea communis]
MNNRLYALAVLSGLASFACAPMVRAEPASPAVQPPVVPAYFAANGIQVLKKQRGPGGLTAWTISRNGVQTIMYTTPKDDVMISGVLWDAKTGKNLSDQFMTDEVLKSAQVQQQAAAAVKPNPSAVISVDGPVRAKAGKVSDAIRGIDVLPGVKEGTAGPAGTLYIFFDPRCPHCKNVYSMTRDFVKKGGTIKWLPVTVLSPGADGKLMVADILQDPNPVAAMARIESGGFRSPSRVDKKTTDAIAQNEGYFWAAFDRNPAAGQAGVPVAFFQTPDGAPQMVGSIDDRELLSRILKDMSK